METSEWALLVLPAAVSVAAWIIGRPRIRDLRMKTGDDSWITAVLAGTRATAHATVKTKNKSGF